MNKADFIRSEVARVLRDNPPAWFAGAPTKDAAEDVVINVLFSEKNNGQANLYCAWNRIGIEKWAAKE